MDELHSLGESSGSRKDYEPKSPTSGALRWRSRWWRWDYARWRWIEIRAGSSPLVGAGKVKTARKYIPHPYLEGCFGECSDLRPEICPDRVIELGIVADMRRVLEEKECLDCCFQRALLVQCKTEKEVAALSVPEWGPVLDETMVSQAVLIAALVGRAVEISFVTESGLEQFICAGVRRKDVPPMRVLVVHLGKREGRFIRHAVPMYTTLKSEKLLDKYRRNAMRCGKSAPPPAEEPQTVEQAVEEAPNPEPQEAESSNALPPVQVPVVVAPPQGVKVDTQTDLPPPKQVERVSIACGPDEPTKLEWLTVTNRWECRRGRDAAWTQTWSTTKLNCNLREVPRSRPAQMPIVVRQPAVLGLETKPWSDKLMNFNPFRDHSRVDLGLFTRFMGSKAVPDLCPASISNVRRYGASGHYVFADHEPGHFMNGCEPDYFLRKEDIIKTRGASWVFVREDTLYGWSDVQSYSLKIKDVEEAGCVDYLSAAYPSVFSGRLKEAIACEVDDKLPEDISENILWRNEHMTQKDPLTASNLCYARNKAAAGLDIPAKETAAKIRAATKPYRDVLVGFGGRYSWGYCYSCGEERKGKYELRLCQRCLRGANSMLGRAVAAGEQLLTTANPMAYPGVVHREKQHPGLKRGVQSTIDGPDGKPLLGKGSKVRVIGPDGRQLMWDDIQSLLVESKGPFLGAFAIDGAGPYTTQGGVRPLVEAICYRVFKKLDTAKEPRVIDERSFATADRLARELLLRTFLEATPEVMLILEYIMSNPSPRRRKALFEAWRKWSENGSHSPDWEYISAFVKQENLPWFTPRNGVLNSAQREYIARLIQAPHDETHIVAGRYLKPLMAELKKCWSKDNWIYYASSPPETLNQWLKRIQGCQTFFWSDYSAFDATFSEHTWKMIEGFYRTIYPDAELDFWKVMDIWRRPQGRMRLRREGYKVEYDAGVCNCSGRDDTALANALFNGLALSCSFAAALARKPLHELTAADLLFASDITKISICGDDSLVGCDFDVAIYQDEVIANLKSFGLCVKAESSRSLDDVTYLGMMPYQIAPQEYIWGPTIGRRMYKMGWQTELSHPASWARGIAQCGKLLRHVPILYEMSCQIDSLLVGKSITRQQRDGNRPWASYSEEQAPYSMLTKQQLCRRYPGLTVGMIEEDIRRIKSIKRLPVLIRLESLEVILQTDDL